MGYDLHITRKHDWSDKAGPTISEAEWRALIDADPELTIDTDIDASGYVFAAWKGTARALSHYGDNITAKNPDEALIAKMVAIAEKLGATVQGDDGEVYGEDRSPPANPEAAVPTQRPGFFARLRTLFTPKAAATAQSSGAPTFRVGERVKNHWGEVATVISIDRKANGGLGSIQIRLDDGRKQTMSYIASGLEKAD